MEHQDASLGLLLVILGTMVLSLILIAKLDAIIGKIWEWWIKR